MISNGLCCDSSRACNTFMSWSVNETRLSRSSLIGTTTEIHGWDEWVMRSGYARHVNHAEESPRHCTEGLGEIQTEGRRSSAIWRSTNLLNVGSLETKMMDHGSSLEHRRRKITSRTEGAMLCRVPSTIRTCGLVTMARARSSLRIWLKVNWVLWPVTLVVSPSCIRSISSSSSTNARAHWTSSYPIDWRPSVMLSSIVPSSNVGCESSIRLRHVSIESRLTSTRFMSLYRTTPVDGARSPARILESAIFCMLEWQSTTTFSPGATSR